MATEKNKETVRRFIKDGINEGNDAVVSESLSSDVVFRDSSGEPMSLPFTAVLQVARSAFPDFNVVIEDMVAERDKVVCRVKLNGTQKGQLMHVPPTGNRASASGTFIFCLSDGKISELWGITDVLGAMQQLGIVPSLEGLGLKAITPRDIVEKNKAVVRRIIEEGWNKGSLETVRELIAKDFVAHQPGKSQMPESAADHVHNARLAFPDLQFVIEEMIGEGDRVVTHVTMKGTNSGALMGRKPTGKYAAWKAIYTARVIDGKLVESWGNPDAFSALRQIGIVPSPGAKPLQP